MRMWKQFQLIRPWFSIAAATQRIGDMIKQQKERFPVLKWKTFQLNDVIIKYKFQ